MKGKGDLLQMRNVAALAWPVTVRLVNRGNDACRQAPYGGAALDQDATERMGTGE